MKKALPFLVSFVLTVTSFNASAENLLEVYDQAIKNNPELQKSHAEQQIAYSSAKESIGVLLPQLAVVGTVGRIYGSHGAKNNNSNMNALTAKLSQTLFNLVEWKQLSIMQKRAVIADISYQGQHQALILNTAAAYFNVIKSIDILKTVQAQKKAIGTQLDQIRQRYRVGLTPIMDVQNAQAQYDQSSAQEIISKNNLSKAIEELRQITGTSYTELSTLSKKLAQEPIKYDIKDLLDRANKNNVQLLGARTAVEVANEQIKMANAAHLPTLTVDVTSGLSKGHIDTSDPTLNSEFFKNDKVIGVHSITANLTLPIFSGGRIMQKAKQAHYNHESYLQQLESAKRSVEKDVRSSYNNIIAAQGAIKAYQQTVVSAESALTATRSSYNVGARTIVDVLNATTALYNAKQLLAESQYSYLTSLLALKAAIGELDRKDLEYLNDLLAKKVSTVY